MRISKLLAIAVISSTTSFSSVVGVHALVGQETANTSDNAKPAMMLIAEAKPKLDTTLRARAVKKLQTGLGTGLRRRVSPEALEDILSRDDTITNSVNPDPNSRLVPATGLPNERSIKPAKKKRLPRIV